MAAGLLLAAIAIAPSEPAMSGTRLGVILGLHGAGVEASSSFWTNAFRRQRDAWVCRTIGRGVFSNDGLDCLAYR